MTVNTHNTSNTDNTHNTHNINNTHNMESVVKWLLCVVVYLLIVWVFLSTKIEESQL